MICRLNDYQDAAWAYARYPSHMRITYPALGLCGESGELGEKALAALPGPGCCIADIDEPGSESRAALLAEVGDVLWYVAASANDLQCDLSYVDEKARRLSLPTGNAMNNLALALCSEAGKYADKVKKVYRDTAGEVSDDTREALLDQLARVFWYVGQIIRRLSADIYEVAQWNLDKLESRKSRGVLSGSGDNR